MSTEVCAINHNFHVDFNLELLHVEQKIIINYSLREFPLSLKNLKIIALRSNEAFSFIFKKKTLIIVETEKRKDCYFDDRSIVVVYPE